MPRGDLILFCDLETTGSDYMLDGIIEVGISVWTWPQWTEDFYASYVVAPTPAQFDRMVGKRVVREMHEANGLWDDVRNIRHDPAFRVDAVDRAVDEALSRYGTRGSAHIPLAGSGVSHFDRPFIHRYMPRFDARLSYWAYDVGVVRRMFELAGAPIADYSGKTHRALDDARVHASEFRYYMDVFTGLTLANKPPEAIGV